MYKLNINNMVKSFSFFVLAFAISSFTTNISAKNEMIPIEKLVCYGQGTGFDLSPSGDYVAAMVPIDENKCDIEDLTDQQLMQSRRVLVVTNINTKEAKVLSGTTAGSAVSDFSWLNDNQLLITRDGRAELDSYSYYIMDRDGKNSEMLIEAKKFKNKPGYEIPRLAGIYSKFPDKVMVSISRGSSYSRDYYWLNLDTKQKTLVVRQPTIKNESVTNFLFDHNGNAKGFLTTATDGQDMGLVNSFYLYNNDGSFDKIGSCRHQAACFTPLRFDIDNTTLLGVGQAIQPDGSIINETDTNALWAFDTINREFTEMIYHDPDYDLSAPRQGSGGLRMWFDNSTANTELFGFAYEAAKTKKVYFDNYFASVSKSLEGAFEGYEISLADWSSDLSRFLVNVSSSFDPGTRWFFDVTTGKLVQISSPRPWLEAYEMAKTKPFTYTARDGLKLHGYITLPVDYVKGTKIPFIVHPHGGPNARDYYQYNTEVQFYASRGYGVIQMNYRGSTNYGRSEMILANHEMGKSMQTDKYDALFWARDQGYVDMDKVCISGASYGGYAAMHAATKMPGLFKCVIAYVGVYDLTKSKDLRGLMWGKWGMQQEYVEKGNPDIPEDYANLYENSPNYFVENITEPVLIITGRRDRNVRFQETVDMVSEFKKYGVEHEYIIKGDEGHGYSKESSRLELWERYEKFLAKYLD